MMVFLEDWLVPTKYQFHWFLQPPVPVSTEALRMITLEPNVVKEIGDLKLSKSIVDDFFFFFTNKPFSILRSYLKLTLSVWMVTSHLQLLQICVFEMSVCLNSVNLPASVKVQYCVLLFSPVSSVLYIVCNSTWIVFWPHSDGPNCATPLHFAFSPFDSQISRPGYCKI